MHHHKGTFHNEICVKRLWGHELDWTDVLKRESVNLDINDMSDVFSVKDLLEQVTKAKPEIIQ